MPSAWDPDSRLLDELLEAEPPYRRRQVDEGLWQRLERPIEMTNLPIVLRERLEDALDWQIEVLAERSSDSGATTKWALSLADGATVETVLMAYEDRVTVCVSSQAGCAMGCTFCATGQAGFRRHLSAAEIVEQVVLAARSARPRRLSNVVMMGMGEPLANYDNVLAALRCMNERIGLGARHLTVSTVGVVPGIERLAHDAPQVTLAISLHAGNDELRSTLVPLNSTYPLERVIEAAEHYFERTHRRVSLEWAMIDSVNDSDRDAEELAVIARRLGAHVNLIALNPTPGYGVPATPRSRVRDFRDLLEDLGVNATVRVTRGQEIDAACGQLAAVVGAKPGRRVRLAGRANDPSA